MFSHNRRRARGRRASPHRLRAGLPRLGGWRSDLVSEFGGHDLVRRPDLLRSLVHPGPAIDRALGAMKPDWHIVVDHFNLRVRHETLTRSEFDETVVELGVPSIWDDERLWAEVRAMLPSDRLSKFQPLMPPWMQREMVAAFLLDVEGARSWMERRMTGWA